MLRERVVPLHLKIGPAASRNGVEKDRLLHRRYQGVSDGAQKRMIGPYGQIVLPSLLQFPGIVMEIGGVVAEFGIEPPFPGPDVLFRNECKGGRMRPFVIHQCNGVKDLHGVMGIHCWDDPGDQTQVAVNELTKPPVIVHGARTAAPTDEELKAWKAKRVLDVHQKKPKPHAVLTGGAHSMPFGP